MSWITVAATAVLLVVGVACSPIDVTEAIPEPDVLPPEPETVPGPATDLLPPLESAKEHWLTAAAASASPDEKTTRVKKAPAALFLINIYAVKNNTDESSNDVLHGDVIEEVPDESSEPLAMFILVVEEDDEEHPVSLDEVAKDLEEEGFSIEKVAKNGETRIVKVDLGSVDSMVKVDGESKNDTIGKIIADAAERRAQEATEQPETDDSAKLMKVRRKRHLHKHHRDRECSICGGGGGGGGYYPAPQPVYQPVVIPQPVIIPGGGGGGYHKKPYYPQPCNTCGGGGGGYPPQYGGNNGGYGGGNSYASAQASAQASASSYGK